MIVAKIVENGEKILRMATFGTKNVYSATNPKKRVETSQFKRESIIRSNNNKITGQKNGPKLQAKIIIFLREFLVSLLLLSDIYIF